MPSKLYLMNPSKPGKKKKTKKRPMSAAQKAALVARLRKGKSSSKKRGGSVSKNKAPQVSLQNFMSVMQEGAWNGAGAFATDIVMGVVRPMLPTALGYGPVRHFTRIGLGLLLGNVANRLMPRLGGAIAVGTATVAGYEFAKEFIQPMLPAGMVLGAYTEGDIAPSMGAYTDGGVAPGIGFVNSGYTPGMGNANQETAYYSGGAYS